MDAGAEITLEADGSWILWLPMRLPEINETVRFAAATSTNKSDLENLLDSLENE